MFVKMRWMILLAEHHGGENYTPDLAQTAHYFRLFPISCCLKINISYIMMFQDKCGFKTRFNFSWAVRVSKKCSRQRQDFDPFWSILIHLLWQGSAKVIFHGNSGRYIICGGNIRDTWRPIRTHEDKCTMRISWSTPLLKQGSVKRKSDFQWKLWKYTKYIFWTKRAKWFLMVR